MSETKTIWHPYPKERPNEEGLYMVTADVFFGYGKKVLILNYRTHDKFGFYDDRVIAFAELPDPYKEEKND